MAITFTITAAGGVKIPQSDIATTKNVNLSIASVTDTINVADSDDITNYDFNWYFIDNPSSTASIDTSITADNETVSLNSIDTWGSYRIFVIARHKSTNAKSEENPLKAPEESFITLSVESTSNSLEKPANFERNWKEKYDKLVDVVDSSTKRVNVLKVSNTVSFTLPDTDGTDGQMLTTDGSGQLQFVDLDLTNMENNISLNSLTDVNVVNATPDQVLKWNGSEWIPGASAGISGLTSDEVNDTLTITNGYSLLKESLAEGEVDPGLNHIGSLEEPFDELHIKSINGSLIIGETGRKLLPEILGASGEFLKYLPTGDFGTAFIKISDVEDLNDELNNKLESELNDLTDTVTWANVPDANITQTSVVQHNGALSIASMSDFSTYQSQIFRNDTAITISDTGVDGASFINFTVDGSLSWKINSDGNLLPNTNGLYEIGENTLLGKVAKIWTKDIFTQGLTINSMTYPTTDGSDGQVLSTDGAGTLSFIDQASGGGATDKIEEGNTLVETIDTGTDGHIVLQTEGTERWHITNGGHIIPQSNADYDLGNAENKVRHLFLSDNSLYFGDQEEIPTTATISRSNDAQIMGAYASSKFSIETTKAGFLSTNKTLLTATEPDPILNGTQYAMTFSDGGPVPGWSLEPVEIESSNFTPAYLSVHLTQQNNPLETSKFRNPFNTHTSVGANKATSVNAVSITGQTNGRFTLANPGIYEVTIVLVVNDSNSSTSFKTFTVQVRKNTSFSTNGDPDIDETSGTAITALTTYARHGSVDPVERTVNFIMQTSSQNEYIDILMQGSTQYIALDAGTSISIKRIA